MAEPFMSCMNFYDFYDYFHKISEMPKESF